MADGLGTNDNQATGKNSDLSPVAAQAIGRQVTQVDQLALARDLGEGSAVVLAEGNDLSAVLGGPTPGGRATSIGAATKSLVREEVVQVDL